MTFKNVIVNEIITYKFFIDKHRMKNMFINKAKDGLNNICGKNIARLRTELKISQRELADRMQLVGIDIDKNAI